MTYRPTLTSAQEFSRLHTLEDWVHLFLCAEGHNRAFSQGLRLAPRFFCGPMEIPAERLDRCTGPEPGMKYLVESAGFEVRVRGLMDALEAGTDLPPLIVESQENRLTVNDGNHRLEAAKRLGIPKVWVILWTSNQDELDAIKTGRLKGLPFGL